MRYEQAAVAFEAVVQGFPTGLTGTIGVRVRDNAGNDTIARTTAGITEDIAGSGIYRTNLTIPTVGDFTIVWDRGGALTPASVATEDVTVLAAAPAPPGPPVGSSYAAVDDVLARAGRVRGAFSVVGKHPDSTDIENFLLATAQEIDAAIRARGFDPDSLDPDTKEAFRDLNAYGALSRALSAMAGAPRDMLDEARLVWESAIGTPQDPAGSIARGTFPAIAVLEAGEGGGGEGSTAGSLWDEEPEYGTQAWADAEAAVLRGTNFAPTVTRGQKL